jgi:hypothetical protein
MASSRYKGVKIVHGPESDRPGGPSYWWVTGFDRRGRVTRKFSALADAKRWIDSAGIKPEVLQKGDVWYDSAGRRHTAGENPMKATVKKRLLIVGGIVGLGVVAYYLWQRSQESTGPVIAPTPSPTPLPPPKTTTQGGPTSTQIQAYKNAVAELDRYTQYFRTNTPWNDVEMAAA